MKTSSLRVQVEQFKILTRMYADLTADMGMEQGEHWTLSREGYFDYDTNESFTVLSKRFKISVYRYIDRNHDGLISLDINRHSYSQNGDLVTIANGDIDNLEHQLAFAELFMTELINSFVLSPEISKRRDDISVELDNDGIVIINTGGSGYFVATKPVREKFFESMEETGDYDSEEIENLKVTNNL